MTDYYTMDDFDLSLKTVLLRVDINAPLDKETLDIIDTTRMARVVPTISELVKKRAKTVVLAHQGRKGSWDFVPLEAHARALSKLLDHPVKFVPDVFGDKALAAIKAMKDGEVLLLDNVRGVDGETPKKAPEEHAKHPMVRALAEPADRFINDAFAAAHRSQCSLVGFTPVLPSMAGRLLEKELVTLEKIFSKPDRPATFVFGGAKFSDAIPVLSRLLDGGTADSVILTGVAGNAFLRASGKDLGRDNNDFLLKDGTRKDIDQAKKLLDKHGDRIRLPPDVAVESEAGRTEIKVAQLPTPYPIYDIGEQACADFEAAIKESKTVFLSGPAGMFESRSFARGTERLFKAAAGSGAFTVAGGGHTVAALEKLGIAPDIDYISTGGGSLEKFMLGEKLDVVEALKASRKKFAKK